MSRSSRSSRAILPRSCRRRSWPPVRRRVRVEDSRGPDCRPSRRAPIIRWHAVRSRSRPRAGVGEPKMAKSGGAKGKGKADDTGHKVVARNRRARFEFDLLEKVEAGIVLTGTEVKSLRNGKASLE